MPEEETSHVLQVLEVLNSTPKDEETPSTPPTTMRNRATTPLTKFVSPLHTNLGAGN